MKIPDFATKVPFRRVFRNCESDFGTRVPLHSTVTFISQLRNGLRSGCENGFLLRNWLFSAKLNLTLSLPLFLYIPLSCEKGFKIERAILADCSSPSSSPTPRKPPVIFSDHQFWPTFDNPKWREPEGPSRPLRQAARKSRERSEFQNPSLSLCGQKQFLLR